MLIGLMGLTSSAYFSDQTMSEISDFVAKGHFCSLKVNPCDSINFAQACKLMPKQSQTYRLTVKNDGTMPARWRLALQHNKGSERNEAYLNCLVATFYSDRECTKVTYSARITDFLLDDEHPNNWLYDWLLCGESDPVLLAAGEQKELFIRIDFEGTAPKEARSGQFNCDFVLDSCQEGGEADWNLTSAGLSH